MMNDYLIWIIFKRFHCGGTHHRLFKRIIKGFDQFHVSTPFNAKRKVFKHYRSATQSMVRELNVNIKGIRGSMGTKGFRPVFMWEGDTPVLCFKSREWAFHWTSTEYEKRTGFKASSVE
ncbi:hypothetical protein [Lentibacillus amyloliquefaciens]|uniref:Uncharacterized protein n=1 Tax=Lentibacillus amyloliquefaciens TaxID=1472767 RepID=A0A0U4FB96_9BACI|nr:hypothetical protein [Lentibacillus amyloliquefaciens]ALX47773.1 hypothetical protein AOX59_03615 [Lentibacillus amyloliquefaciens]